jgi:phenylpropionate dioxygenase-like ring-hydroxylating dioxygenase large terminal subunit
MNIHLDRDAVRSVVKTSRLSQYWHPIAESRVIADRPQQFTLLGEKLVAFRTEAGVSVFKDLCVHRGAALSGGSVRNGCLVCPYHGWEYDQTGACVRIPSLPQGSPIPTRARAIRYHAEERYGLVWVALEDPVAPIPGFPENEADDPAFQGEVFLHLTWNTSAGRSTENSMDVSHFPFVHPGILGDPEFTEIQPYELHQTEWGQYYRVNNQFWRSVDGKREARITYEYHHYYPFTVHMRALEDNGRVLVVTVCASPTETAKTNVFRIAHRNYPNDDPQFVQDYLHILEQDREVVEGIRPELIPPTLKEELHIKAPDLSSIEFRRWLSKVDCLGLLEP